MSAATSSGGFRVFARDEAASYACMDSILLVVGRGPRCTSQVAENYSNAIRDMVKEHPSGFALITYIRPGSTPDSEARDIMVSCFREAWDQLRAALFVVETTGFEAAVQRSVVSAFTIATGMRSRFRIAKRLEPDIIWLAGNIGASQPDVIGARIAHAVRQVVTVEAPDF